jgi:hypothetical protein
MLLATGAMRPWPGAAGEFYLTLLPMLVRAVFLGGSPHRFIPAPHRLHLTWHASSCGCVGLSERLGGVPYADGEAPAVQAVDLHGCACAPFQLCLEAFELVRILRRRVSHILLRKASPARRAGVRNLCAAHLRHARRAVVGSALPPGSSGWLHGDCSQPPCVERMRGLLSTPLHLSSADVSQTDRHKDKMAASLCHQRLRI